MEVLEKEEWRIKRVSCRKHLAEDKLDKRIGIFSVQGSVVRGNPASLLPIMQNCVVIDVAYDKRFDVYIYTALSYMFDQIPYRHQPMEYIWTVDETDPDRIIVSC